METVRQRNLIKEKRQDGGVAVVGGVVQRRVRPRRTVDLGALLEEERDAVQFAVSRGKVEEIVARLRRNHLLFVHIRGRRRIFTR